MLYATHGSPHKKPKTLINWNDDYHYNTKEIRKPTHWTTILVATLFFYGFIIWLSYYFQ